MNNPTVPTKPAETPSNLSFVDKAAILLMSLGESDAAEVLRHLGPKEVQRIGSAMSQLKSVQQRDVEAVMGSFLEEVRNLTGLGTDADNYIRNMLVAGLGEDKASGLIDRILMGGNTSGLDTLKWLEARSVADILRNEHPQIQAIVTSYLDPDQAAEVLGYLSEKMRIDIMMRIASLDTVQPSALQELNDILERQYAEIGRAPCRASMSLRAGARAVNR